MRLKKLNLNISPAELDAIYNSHTWDSPSAEDLTILAGGKCAGTIAEKAIYREVVATAPRKPDQELRDVYREFSHAMYSIPVWRWPMVDTEGMICFIITQSNALFKLVFTEGDTLPRAATRLDNLNEDNASVMNLVWREDLFDKERTLLRKAIAGRVIRSDGKEIGVLRVTQSARFEDDDDTQYGMTSWDIK